jgi:hypothetical protein
MEAGERARAFDQRGQHRAAREPQLRAVHRRRELRGGRPIRRQHRPSADGGERERRRLGQASELSPPANANTSPGTQDSVLSALACTGVGTCETVGSYVDTGSNIQPMAASSAPSLAIQTATLPAAAVGVSYNAQLQASGGAGTYAWSVSSGSLPAGLHLDAHTGVISGTPTAMTNASFTVAVSDPGPPGQTAQATLAIATALPAAPNTIVRKVKITSKHHTATFKVGTTGVASGWQCALVRVHTGKHTNTRGRATGLAARSSATSTCGPGRYIFYARAFGPGGLDRTPAVRRFTDHLTITGRRPRRAPPS